MAGFKNDSFGLDSPRNTVHQRLLGYDEASLCEFEPEKLAVSPHMVGIDLGLTDLFTRCNGVKEPNPKHTAKYAARLSLLQRRLSKKKAWLSQPPQGQAQSCQTTRKRIPFLPAYGGDRRSRWGRTSRQPPAFDSHPSAGTPATH